MIKQHSIEYNLRQIVLMQERITFYRNNQISIKNFIDDIDALVACIQDPPEYWIQSIKRMLWKIEIIYATALTHNEVLTDEKLQKFSKFIFETEKLIIWYKNYLLRLSN